MTESYLATCNWGGLSQWISPSRLSLHGRRQQFRRTQICGGLGNAQEDYIIILTIALAVLESFLNKTFENPWMVFVVRKRCNTQLEHKWDVHLSFLSHWDRTWVYHWVCDAWPVWRQTYGYLPSLRASPPFGRYQILLLGEQRHMCVNNSPRVVMWSEQLGLESATYWLQVRCPNHYATTPHWY